MSLTLIGAIGGLLSSAVPEVLNIFKGKQERKDQIELMKTQILAKRNDVDLTLQQFEATKDFEESKQLREHDIALSKGKGFFAGLSKSVRPTLTYFFFGLFVTVKISHLVYAIQSGDFNSFNVAINEIWDPETEAMFAAIMGFWFGNRYFEKKNKVG